MRNHLTLFYLDAIESTSPEYCTFMLLILSGAYRLERDIIQENDVRESLLYTTIEQTGDYSKNGYLSIFIRLYQNIYLAIFIMLFALISLYVYIHFNKLLKRIISLLTQSDFSKFTNLNISINNILVFAAVMNTGGVVPASYYMNCSPSAVSLSLKKFCSCFPNSLFSREGRRLIPTEEARLLYNDISPAIKNLLHVMTSSIDISSIPAHR